MKRGLFGALRHGFRESKPLGAAHLELFAGAAFTIRPRFAGLQLVRPAIAASSLGHALGVQRPFLVASV